MITRLSGSFQAVQPRFANQPRKTYAEIFNSLQISAASDAQLKQLAAQYPVQIEYMREFQKDAKSKDLKHLQALYDAIQGKGPAASRMSTQEREAWIANQFKSSLATVINLSQGQANTAMPNEGKILRDLERMLTQSLPAPLSTGHR